MTPDCAPAKPRPTPPRHRAPAGSCDCHFHVFGPYDRFPLDAGRPYTPPEASVEHYADTAAVLGLERRVIVTASVSGTDNAVTMDAVGRLGRARSRAIVVVDDASDLEALAAGGAVGVRFNAVSGNGASLDALEALARRIAPLGWHVQVFTHDLPALADRLAALPVPVVLDHMGGAQAAEGPDGPAMRALLRLLEGGNAWVKLSGYRSAPAPYAGVDALAKRLLAAAPERCVWGTDWPHTGFRTETEMLDDGTLLDWMHEWTGGAWERVLVDNPARLYGF